MYPGSVHITNNINMSVRTNKIPFIRATYQGSLGKIAINYDPNPIVKYKIVQIGILLLRCSNLDGGVLIKKSNEPDGPKIAKV